MTKQLDFDGERVVPGKTPIYLIWAHTSRYLFAKTLLQGSRLLDAGCGEGYGIRYLAQFVKHSVGIDIDPEAAAHARQTYSDASVDFTGMDCCQLGLADGTFDCVVSFEVIEHFHAVDNFLAEIRRVMSPTGIFIVSTPNKARNPAGVNPFHQIEYTANDFRGVLERHFPQVECYGQFCNKPIREKLFMESTRLYLNSKWYRNILNRLAFLYFSGERSENRSADPNWVEKINPGVFRFEKQSIEDATYLIGVCRNKIA